MSFKISSGLFKFDFTDHHAILGVAVDADFKDIRKRYLQIARCLHPDSCLAKSDADKQRANQLLSKLVNPAYEQFSQQRKRDEYIVLLKEMGKHAAQESATIELKSERALLLNQTNNLEHVYKTSILQLAQKQYDSLDKALQMIAQISELNLVYLMRTQGNQLQLSPPPISNKIQPSPSQNNPPPPPPPQKPKQPPAESLAEPYLRRAQALIEKNQFAPARVELEDALKLEPNNSRCHSLMGIIYLKQNLTTMAKVHVNKALQLNPQDPMALQGKQVLDKLAQKAAGKSKVAPTHNQPQPTQGKKPDNSGGSGLFGGLFGGKKK